MNLADYRRFVSYIYAYRNGKKEKNTGFAKVEARKRNLRISIQLEAQPSRSRLQRILIRISDRLRTWKKPADGFPLSAEGRR